MTGYKLHKTRQQEKRSRESKFCNLFLKSYWVWCHILESLPPHTTGKQLFYKSEGSYGIVSGLCNSGISTINRCRHTQAHAVFSSSCPKATKPYWHYATSARKTYGTCCNKSHRLSKSTHAVLKLLLAMLKSGPRTEKSTLASVFFITLTITCP